MVADVRLEEGLALEAAGRFEEVNIQRGREFFIDNLLVCIHSIIERILADRPCAMGV